MSRFLWEPLENYSKAFKIFSPPQAEESNRPNHSFPLSNVNPFSLGKQLMTADYFNDEPRTPNHDDHVDNDSRGFPSDPLPNLILSTDSQANKTKNKQKREESSSK
jgi:hypothetical protein